MGRAKANAEPLVVNATLDVLLAELEIIKNNENEQKAKRYELEKQIIETISLDTTVSGTLHFRGTTEGLKTVIDAKAECDNMAALSASMDEMIRPMVCVPSVELSKSGYKKAVALLETLAVTDPSKKLELARLKKAWEKHVKLTPQKPQLSLEALK